MTLVVLSIVAATALGLAFRGSFARLGQPATRRNGLLAFGALSLCTVFIAKHPSVWAGWMAAGAVALIAYARLNRGRPGLALMAGGMLLNVLVIALNASMPLSLDAVERAGVPEGRLETASDPLREPLVDDTRLPWIGETVPLALPFRPDVASPGDLLVAAGAAVFMFTGLTGRGRPRPEPPKSRKGRRARNRKQAADLSDQTTGTVASIDATGDVAAGVGLVGAGVALGAEDAGVGRELDPFTGGRLRTAPQPVSRQETPVEIVAVAVPDPVTPAEFGPAQRSRQATDTPSDLNGSTTSGPPAAWDI